MIKLKNVSKFYYNKGIVASGFNKISLDFDLGEFVAITGESGSGKSTLLNVLSGLDSYEEGEMYIDGQETSHYTEKDYEIYRKKYIGNIFQNFNLVNSYTVYQNVELVLLLNGYKKKDIKQKVLNIIKDVDLYKYRNKKVSKLSGGQKQRVAIARALAKDTPIILADEPTGNLDSASSDSVLKLLSNIAKDKLVIIVTHNYDQIEKYVTRKITMHDGKVLEDKKIKKHDRVDEIKISTFKEMTIFNKIRLGIRNTFNIIPKFILVFIVYLFIILAFTSSYSSFKKSEYEMTKQGYNSYFNNTKDTRIVIKKKDKTAFTDEDYEKIENIKGIEKVVKNDLSLDTRINLSSDDSYYFYGISKNINEFNMKLDYGRMPENEKEIILVGNKDNYYFSNQVENLIDKKVYLEELSNYETNTNYSLTIVGVKINESSVVDMNYGNIDIYLSEDVINEIVNNQNRSYSSLKYTFASNTYESFFGSIKSEILPSDKVSSGKYIISEEMKYQCKNSKCKNYKLYIDVKNLYYSDSLSLSYGNYYKKSTINNLTGYSYDKYNGAIFINTDDYNDLFNKGFFQSSVFLNNVDNKDTVINALEDMNIKPLYIKDTLYNAFDEDLAFIKIFKVISLSILLFTLFFISYFIIKIILKSRNVYFSTLRILGSSSKAVKQLLNIELFTISNLAYIFFVILILLVNKNILNIKYLKDMYSYLSIYDYLIIYIMLFLMSRLITSRYERKLFNTSAMNAYREEA